MSKKSLWVWTNIKKPRVDFVLLSILFKYTFIENRFFVIYKFYHENENYLVQGFSNIRNVLQVSSLLKINVPPCVYFLVRIIYSQEYELILTGQSIK